MDSVAPLPSGGGVTVIAEHRGQRDRDGRPAGDEKGDDKGDGEAQRKSASLASSVQRDSPAPVEDEELVPAETLFAATLMANEMATASNASATLRRVADHTWTPPDSPLRLKDKLV